MKIKGNKLETAEVIWTMEDLRFYREIEEELRIALRFLKWKKQI